ncbi:MAG: hypothetical protein EA342_14830 [Leptolyngbya sp. LCM1.Bin17]|nr:MAG: hypothetical protein EA342_14830 [Leptolyngbya sp. LCM1.Bin17]
MQTGTIVSIERVDRKVTDPDMGRVLRTHPFAGQIELIKVDADSSVGTIIQGTGVQVGNRAMIVP